MLKKEIFHSLYLQVLHRRSQSEVGASANQTRNNGLSPLINDDFHRGGTSVAEPKVFQTLMRSFVPGIARYIEQEQFAVAQIAEGNVTTRVGTLRDHTSLSM